MIIFCTPGPPDPFPAVPLILDTADEPLACRPRLPSGASAPTKFACGERPTSHESGKEKTTRLPISTESGFCLGRKKASFPYSDVISSHFTKNLYGSLWA